MRLTDIKPQFLLVMGGAGSGKNHFISQNYPQYKLVDVDEVKAELGLNAAIGAIKPMLINAFERKENVAHPTTGSNLSAQERKIELAKSYGYAVTVVLINTDPAKAISQVRNRVEQGGHDVAIENIVSSNKKAKENFNILASLADKSNVITN